MKRIAVHIITYRWYWLAGIVLATIFFGYHASQMKMVTVFDDLFPQQHRYIKVHNKFRELFGGANLVSLELRVKEGNIFNTKTLEKLKRITLDIEAVPWIHPYQIVSLARRNVRDIKVSGWGMKNFPVMYPDVPQTQEGLDELRDTVYHNDMIYGTMVSLDGKSTLLQAVFIRNPRTGEDIDYKLVFDKINEICDRERDENTIINLSGNPILYGWIYSYFNEMKCIFAITVTIIVALLFFYFRSVIGVIRPLISGFISAVWGLGLANLLGYNIDPLIIVIPFLISARVVSHSVQMVRRYDEAYYEHRDVKTACIESCAALMAPGLLGVITDGLGILVILTAPIPMLTKMAMMGFYWVMSIIVSVLILDPILLSFLPAPSVKEEKFKEVAIIHHTLGFLGGIPYSKKGRRTVIVLTVIIFAIGGYYGQYLKIGDAKPGTPILWPDSEYNRATASVNEKFTGTDQLFVIVEGQEKDIIEKPESMKLMEDFQRHMEVLPEVGGTLSLASVTPRVNEVLHYGDPKWGIQAFHNAQLMGMLVVMFAQGCEPGEMDRFMSRDGRLANLIFFVKDHKGDTIERVLNRAKTFIKENPSEKIKFKLAGGIIGVLGAANEVIARAEIVSIALAFLVVFVTCAIAYRSFFAGLLFVIPLVASNYLTFAYMAYRDIGMNVNTLPISALGIGLGVDYGIYIVSRMKEEYAKVKDYKQASINALSTAGGAVLFTGTTLIAGVIFWYFLSSLRFQAEMGLLLAMWMFISMLGGMVLIPTVVAMVRPKFIARAGGPGSG
ncbi:MAG: MMPL family transporter [Deltaproteobacteria bacterium]|nr:MMPL family transporter [Deltaproteobacteria bacterium]